MPKRLDFQDTLYNAEWLRERYATMNAPQIAELLGCTRGAVLDNLRKHGIPIQRGRFAKHVGSNAPRPRGPFRDTLHNPAWLKEHFEEKHLSASTIAKMVGCSAHSAWVAIKKHLGVETTVRSVQPAEVLHEFKGRTKARRLYPIAEPCIVCGEKGTRNHVDGNTHNNDPSNIEWLCLSHHLMVDKRRATLAARWASEQRPDLWRRWHDEVLEEVKANPDVPTRNQRRMKMPGFHPRVTTDQPAVPRPYARPAERPMKMRVRKAS